MKLIRIQQPRKSLERGCQKLISPQDSDFRKWRSPLKAFLNEFTPSNTLAWQLEDLLGTFLAEYGEGMGMHSDNIQLLPVLAQSLYISHSTPCTLQSQPHPLFIQQTAGGSALRISGGVRRPLPGVLCAACRGTKPSKLTS